MKKFFAFLLAFLIVLGVYFLMKKQTQPSNNLSPSVKTLFGMEKPNTPIASGNTKDNQVVQPTPLPTPKEEDDIFRDLPTATKKTGDTVATPQPSIIPSQEAKQATGTPAVNPEPIKNEDDGLTPLQRAIKAKNEGK